MIAAFFAFLVPIGSLLAQQQVPIEVTVKDTVQEQYELARTIVQRSSTASTADEKMRLTATAIETLEVIGRRWPSENAWIVAAAIMESDLFSGTNAPGNALPVLERAERSLTPGIRNGGALLLRLGRVNAQMHNDPAALAYLLRAEAAAGRDGSDIRFSVDLALSDVYERMGDRPSAAKRLRRLSTADRIHDFSKVSFRLRAADDWAAAGNTEEARADLDQVDVILLRTKSAVQNANDARQQTLYEGSAKRLRDKLKRQ